MKVKILRESLLKPLQYVSGVAEKKQDNPILSHILIEVGDDNIRLLTTDTNTEMESYALVEQTIETGKTTVPARKMLDIVKALPEESLVEFSIKQDKLLIKAGTGRFSLATLPADGFPIIGSEDSSLEFSIFNKDLKNLLDSVSFAMAQQDVRYYLNGLLFDIKADNLTAVATDGHRLAVNNYKLEKTIDTAKKIIIPRKTVFEMLRMLGDDEASSKIKISDNLINITVADCKLTAKLLEGSFPDYKNVIPQRNDKKAIIKKEKLKQALARASVIFSEKYRGIRFHFSSDKLQLIASNLEKEISEETIELNYKDDELEIGFNGKYILDILSTFVADEVLIELKDSNSSAVVRELSDSSSKVHLLMPMHL